MAILNKINIGDQFIHFLLENAFKLYNGTIQGNIHDNQLHIHIEENGLKPFNMVIKADVLETFDIDTLHIDHLNLGCHKFMNMEILYTGNHPPKIYNNTPHRILLRNIDVLKGEVVLENIGISIIPHYMDGNLSITDNGILLNDKNSKELWKELEDQTCLLKSIQYGNTGGFHIPIHFKNDQNLHDLVFNKGSINQFRDHIKNIPYFQFVVSSIGTRYLGYIDFENMDNNFLKQYGNHRSLESKF